MADLNDAKGRFEIKKYPNRRYYDVTRSRHVTLTDLYVLVRDGNEIAVTDSASGQDITNVVLAQIILEHDPPKLGLFPASLLHQAIQTNEQMVRKFIDQYFSQAMDAFVQSKKQFDDYLRGIGFSAMTPMAPFDWVRMLLPQGRREPPAPFPSQESSEPLSRASAGRVSASAEAGDNAVGGLQAELAALRRELNEMRQASAPRSPKPRKKQANQRKR